MVEKTSYELSNAELLKRFMNACARAGISNSGLCIDIAAGADIVQMSYLRGVVLARMDGQKPPFEPGMKVRMKDGNISVQSKRYSGPKVTMGEVYSIDRVWYEDGWYLTFNEFSRDFSEMEAQYPATKFCLAEFTT